uniref:HTH cro/C1-type domain-containing protein n=1 Tax=uncultured bacterium fosmid pJB84G2 TaxID=1478072 RepID=A0A0H3UAQ0_9BACT|nr:hypothetical protein [uncultured bacterium fosmid pJB84G2]
MTEKKRNRLRDIRIAKGYSEKELADRLSVNESTVAGFENGTVEPSIDDLEFLSKIYCISLDDMLNENKPIDELFKTKRRFEFHTSGIHIEDDNVNINIGDTKEFKIHHHTSCARMKAYLGLITSILAIAAFILLGVLCNAWHVAWTVLLLTLIVPALYETIAYKKPSSFPIIPIVVGTYCAVGLSTGIWHPTWVMIFAIPLYYMIIGFIKTIKEER